MIINLNTLNGGGGGGTSVVQNYQIVSDLSAITNPVEGMVAMIPEHDETITLSGYTISGLSAQYQQSNTVKVYPTDLGSGTTQCIYTMSGVYFYSRLFGTNKWIYPSDYSNWNALSTSLPYCICKYGDNQTTFSVATNYSGLSVYIDSTAEPNAVATEITYDYTYRVYDQMYIYSNSAWTFYDKEVVINNISTTAVTLLYDSLLKQCKGKTDKSNIPAVVYRDDTITVRFDSWRPYNYDRGVRGEVFTSPDNNFEEYYLYINNDGTWSVTKESKCGDITSNSNVLAKGSTIYSFVTNMTGGATHGASFPTEGNLYNKIYHLDRMSGGVMLANMSLSAITATTGSINVYIFDGDGNTVGHIYNSAGAFPDRMHYDGLSMASTPVSDSIVYSRTYPIVFYFSLVDDVVGEMDICSTDSTYTFRVDSCADGTQEEGVIIDNADGYEDGFYQYDVADKQWHLLNISYV